MYSFLVENTFLLFAAKGLVFFAVGLAIVLEGRRARISGLSASLPWLAAYAFVFGLNNWLQMILVVNDRFTPGGDVSLLHGLWLLSFVLGTLLLLQFGIRLATSHDARIRWMSQGFWVLVVVYDAVVAAVLSKYSLSGNWVSGAEIWARVLLYAPALGLAGWGMLLQRRELLEQGLPEIGRQCTGAAAALGVKAVLSGLIAVPAQAAFVSQGSMWILGLYTLRGVTAVAVAYWLVRMLDSYDAERRRQLDQFIEERLQTQAAVLQEQRRTCDEIEQWGISMADMVGTISSAINKPLDLDQIMRVVLDETLQLIGMQQGIIQLLDEEAQVLRQVAQAGVPAWFRQSLWTVEVGAGLSGWVAKHGELLIIEDIVQDPRPFVPHSGDVHRFYAGIPITAGGKVLGVLNLLHPHTHKLSEQQIALLTITGQQLGMAIEDARLHTDLRGKAALEERVRLSHELHDNLLQILGYLHLKSQMAQHLLRQGQKEQADTELADIERASARAYDDTRDVIAGLRITLLSGQDLVGAIQDHVREFQARHEVMVALDTEGWNSTSLPSETEIQLLRIIQEALTNVRRHAQANAVWIRLGTDAKVASIEIRDDGIGFDSAALGGDRKQHWGLQTMAERAESVGGRLEISSAPGKGTQVCVHLPLGS